MLRTALANAYKIADLFVLRIRFPAGRQSAFQHGLYFTDDRPQHAPANAMRKDSATGRLQTADVEQRPRDKPTTVEYVNIGLMILSLAIASAIPFELFLFAYAVLGPLHYVTEISWLYDRRFFAPRSTDALPLIAGALLITLGNPDVLGPAATERLNSLHVSGIGIADFFKTIHPDVMFVAFGAALILAVTQTKAARLFGFALVGASCLLFRAGGSDSSASVYFKLFGIYLPTLVHVFIFTGAFTLAGALKRQSAAGYASLGVFLVCGALTLWLPNLAMSLDTGAPAVFWKGFRELSFASLDDLMGKSTQQLIGTNVFTSELVLRLVRFFAFAYTYHYLNWFSKTSIIQWHAVSRGRMILITAMWIASIALYAVNYEIGLRWLFLLSMAHVLLEFPLNHKSFLEIGSELRRRLLPT
jgi:hypothetical protein